MVFDSENFSVFYWLQTLSDMLIHLNMVLLTTWVFTFCPKNQVFLSLKSNSSFNGTLYTF